MHIRRNLKEILDKKHQELQELRGMPMRRGKRKTKALILEAEKHSYSMEVARPKKRRKSGRLMRKRKTEISEAWNILSGGLEREGFTEEIIKKTNYLIVPELYPGRETAFYRDHNVRNVSSDPILPPRFEKVPALMQEFILKLNEYDNREDFHPVEVAALAHLVLAYIHPFQDGNGRTARMLQNVYLDLYEFPVPIIRPEEKQPYQSVLKMGMRSWRGEEEWGIPNFLNYIAVKVNESLDDLLKNRIIS
ncbi:Fic family protein [Candidatus Woesearchaeota archaeon]|nr:Fic family protein [Candidatus Woesearchaeota archaeon]